MANYVLMVLDARKAALQNLKSVENAGSFIQEAVREFLRGKSRFPLKEDEGAVMPQPLPLRLQGQQAGQVLGSYYDGNSPGRDLVPAEIPPYSVVFPVSTDYLDDLEPLKGADIVKAIRNFSAGNNVGSFYPVFINDTEETCFLGIHKRSTFYLEDAESFSILPGEDYLYSLPPGYTGPLRASDKRGFPVSPAPAP